MVSPLRLDSYDIIIAGGGQSGCVLAARLSEDPSIIVLLLEAGQNANDDPRVHTPGLAPTMLNDPEVDWAFVSEPSPDMDGRKMTFPRGKCLGGSSATNFMTLVYPSKAGVDAWAEFGNNGWDWDGLAPYYDKFRTRALPSEAMAEGVHFDYLNTEVLSDSGPIHTSYTDMLSETDKAWVSTWEKMGKISTVDPASGSHVGGYICPSTVNPHTKQRSHAGNSYFAPAASRPNLHVVTGALIDKVELQVSENGVVKATGVTFIHRNERHVANAEAEVIVCAGVIGSPAILERSGIGNRSQLESLNMETVIENSNVGEGLQDHLMCAISLELDDSAQAPNMADPAVIQQALADYRNSKSGLLAHAAAQGMMYSPMTDFIDPKPDEKELSSLIDAHMPTDTDAKAAKLHHGFLRRMLLSPNEATASWALAKMQFKGHKLSPPDIFSPTEPGNFISIIPGLAHPLSRGSVHITSTDPNIYPKITPNYLSNPLDLEVFARHMQHAETFAATPPFSDLLKENGRRLQDGHDAKTLERAKELVRISATSNYHPCGTCAMMSKELGGVVNDRLIAYGTSNLRVCDASIFPILVRGNIQSTVYAVAEKGADIVKEDLQKKRKV